MCHGLRADGACLTLAPIIDELLRVIWNQYYAKIYGGDEREDMPVGTHRKTTHTDIYIYTYIDR